MKKALLIFLAFAMLFSFCACGNDDSETTDPSDSSQSTTNSTENSTGNTESPMDSTEGTTGATQTPTDEPSTPPTQAPADETTTPPTQEPTETPTTPPTTCNHSWKDATCTAPKTCSKCGAIHDFALGHNWKDATCTSAELCSRCGYTTGSSLGHQWKEATCTTAKTCLRCNKVEGSALGHTEVIDKAVSPTCTEPGLTEGRHCSVCNTVIQKQQTINAEHKLSGDTCSVCHQRIPVGKWDASSKQNGELFVYLYNTDNKNEQIIEVVGSGKMKDYEWNKAPWAGRNSDSLKNVVSVTFDDSITYIGTNTFKYMAIKNLKLPNSLISIGESAFWECSIKSITLPDSLQIIGEAAFCWCEISTLRVPDNITIKSNSLCCFFDTLYLPQHVIIEDFSLGWNEDREMVVYYNGTKEEWLATGNVETYFYEDQIVHCTDGDYLTPGHYSH